MTNHDLISQYYNKLVTQYGDSAKSADYGDDTSRILKFIKLSRILDGFNFSSILDIGCGTGFFYEILKNLKSNFYYEGIDISPMAIDFANKKFNTNLFQCINIDDYIFIKKFDLILAIGIFYLEKNSYELIEKRINKLINFGNNICITFKIRNLNTPDNEFHVDVDKIILILERSGFFYTLYRDYHNSDMTILIRSSKNI